MILTIDVGNSNIVLGAYREEELVFEARISSDTKKTSDEMAVLLQAVLANYNVSFKNMEGTIISSVVPSLTATLSKAIELLTGKKPFVVMPGIKTGVNIRIDNPAQLGSDLLVAGVAVANLYPKPAIVIDMGTATTINIVDENNSILGGAIVPGIKAAYEALSGLTAQLPKINIEAPRKVIGTNTIDCMKSGAVFGNAAMLDGMIDRIEEEFGHKCTVIATGGLAEEVCSQTKHNIIYNKRLLLEGLRILYKRNVQ